MFWNPGHASVPAGDLLGRTPKGVPNPLIVAAFRRIGLAWQAGIGIPAIFRDWQRLGHAPPVIRSEEARNLFELSLVAQAPTGQRRSTVPTGAKRADGGGDDDRSADPTSADMGGDHGDHVGGDLDSDQVDHADQVAMRLTARQRAIVEACEVPRSLAELMERAGVSHRSHFRRKHLKPLLEAGIVRMTNPGNPRAPNQRYVLAGVGGS